MATILLTPSARAGERARTPDRSNLYSRGETTLSGRTPPKLFFPNGDEVRPPVRTPAATETVNGRFSSFVVDLSSLSTEEAAAMRHALRRLGMVLVAENPIVIDLDWESLTPGLLATGQAQVHNLTGDFAGVWWPDVLVNELIGFDGDTNLPEMYIKVNSDADWYFGTDGNPPDDENDFVSVIMHELLHGLGFSSEMNKSGSTGSWGFDTDVNKWPVRFDQFLENGANQALTSFTNPSTALGTELTSNSIFFDGGNTRPSNGGQPAKLYAPATWSDVSSLGHLDDLFYDTPNELMTRSHDDPIHDVGPVLRGMLADIGYLIAHIRKLSLDDKRHLRFAGQLTVPLGFRPCRSNIPVQIQRLVSGDWKTVKSENTEGDGDFNIGVPDKAGRYRAKTGTQYKGPTNANMCVPVTSSTVRHNH